MDITLPNASVLQVEITAAPIQQSPKRPNFVDSAVRSHHATTYLYRLFRLCGMYIPRRHRTAYIIYSLVLNGWVNVFYPLSFVISYLRPTGEVLVLGDFLSSLQTCINDFSSAFKFFTMAFMMRRLRSTAGILERLDRRCRRPEEFAELLKLGRLCNAFVIAYLIAFLSYSTSSFLGAFLNGRPMYGTYVPLLDWRLSEFNMIVAALVEYSLMNLTCLLQAADDAYALSYVNILRTHMKILRMRIERLGYNESLSLAEHFQELRQCVTDHKNFLQLFDTVAPIISKTVFIQFLVTAILISVTMVNILLFATDFNSRVASTLYLVGVFMEILPICYYAQCLMDDCTLLSDAIFHANWVGQEKRFRKMLVFLTQRSQRQVRLTAGKLVPITLGSFLSVVKFSFSLYTIIEKMGIKEKLGLN